MIYLQTERLIIRDHKPEDLETHFALFSNKQTTYYSNWAYMETIENAKIDLDNVINEINKEDRKLYFLRIEDKQTNAHIGEIGYGVDKVIPVGKIVGAGYFLYPEFWGKGYATEALREVMRFAFEENNVFRIAADCMKENIGSEKVMIKCGMIKEAEFKSCTWHDGQIKDRLSYRLLKSEWKR
jgi:ribosomal-protein-alanine N-acetyltransferase